MAWLGERGARRTFQPGEVLYEHAVRDAPFYVIERGLVEFIDRKPGKDVYIAQADSGTFIGDIAAFTGEPTISACVAVDTTDVIEFDRQGLRDMMARSPEFGEGIFRTLLARRAWDEAEGHGIMRLIAPRGSRRSFEVRDLLERNLLPVRWYDVDTDAESAQLLEWLDIPRSETPVLVHATNVMRNPSAAQVARSLGLRANVDGERFDLVVLGAGPAGLAAAVYGGAEGLRTFVAERWAPGGQAGTSTRIENYLGFPSGVSGTELTRKATLQARRFDAVLSSFHPAVELADGPEGMRARRPRRRPARPRALRRHGHGRQLARAQGRGRRALPRRRRLPRPDGDRRRALPRRGRDHRRRRQLGGTGRGAPRHAGAQRAHRGARQGAEVDDVALPRRPHRELAPHRGHDRDGGDGGARLGQRGVGQPARIARDGSTLQVPSTAVFVMIGADPCNEAATGILAIDEAGYLLCGAGAAKCTGHLSWPLTEREPHLLETHAARRVRGRRRARGRIQPRRGSRRRRRDGRALRVRRARRLARLPQRRSVSPTTGIRRSAFSW